MKGIPGPGSQIRRLRHWDCALLKVTQVLTEPGAGALGGGESTEVHTLKNKISMSPPHLTSSPGQMKTLSLLILLHKVALHFLLFLQLYTMNLPVNEI